jgi:hypothetical protein
VIEAETQAVLDAFKKMAEALESMQTCGRGTTFRVMVASMPKVIF